MVSELIPHGDLRDFLGRNPKPLPLRQALDLAVGIARGLAAIHEQRIVHRDVKPRNILMDSKDGHWIPKLTDFGLARSTGSMRADSLGSPGYAAPEQWDLTSEPGPESDLFSFGMILFELLTGTKPTTAATADEYTAWLKAGVSPPPPSKIRPELTAWHDLDVLVGGLLEFDRHLRTASAAEAARTLARVLKQVDSQSERVPEPEPVSAPAPPPHPPSQPRPNRSIQSYVIAAAIVMGLIVWIGLTFNRSDTGADAVARTPQTLVNERVQLKANEERHWMIELRGAQNEVKVEANRTSGEPLILYFMDKPDLDNYGRRQEWSYYTVMSDDIGTDSVFDSGWNPMPKAGTYVVLLMRRPSDTNSSGGETVANLRVLSR